MSADIFANAFRDPLKWKAVCELVWISDDKRLSDSDFLSLLLSLSGGAIQTINRRVEHPSSSTGHALQGGMADSKRQEPDMCREGAHDYGNTRSKTKGRGHRWKTRPLTWV